MGKSLYSEQDEATGMGKQPYLVFSLTNELFAIAADAEQQKVEDEVEKLRGYEVKG